MRCKPFLLLFLILIISTLILAGCGGADEESRYSPGEIPLEEPASEEPLSSDLGHDETLASTQQRIVIMQGNMVVESYDPVEIVNFVTDLAERYHGFVVDSKIEKITFVPGDIRTKGSIMIRVPAERLNDAMAEIEAQNIKVIQKELSGKDVTADYVDLKSKLRNLEDAAIQLKMIMENATDTESVLKVYQELTMVTEEEEIVRGQIQYYEEASAMSSLALEVKQIIDEPEPLPTPTPAPWNLGPTFKDSSKRLTNSFQNWLEGVVHFFIFFLPMFILRAGPWLAFIFFAGRWAYRKFRKEKSSTKTDQNITEIDE
jgi:hypothetical protein